MKYDQDEKQYKKKIGAIRQRRSSHYTIHEKYITRNTNLSFK